MKAKKTAGTVLTSLGFVVGFAALTSAAPGSTIGTTGPDSYNKVKNSSSYDLKIKNHNNLSVDNSNYQKAYSGEAKTDGNTNAGGATSGSAANTNSLNASASVNNSASTPALMSSANMGSGSGSGGTASINNTGPDSTNVITNKVTSDIQVHNDNNLSVYTHNSQKASSGDAQVTHNTNGGSATSGSASNTNSTSVTFNVTN